VIFYYRGTPKIYANLQAEPSLLRTLIRGGLQLMNCSRINKREGVSEPSATRTTRIGKKRM